MNKQKPWSRLDWLAAATFAGLVILFYWRILTPNLADRQSFPPGDFHAQFWAFATFEVRELSAGRLPLWNPYTFAGAPFWADVQSAVFYPPSLLTILLSAPWGFSLFALQVEAIAHFWLAAIFMYLFIRALTRSRAAAFIAALTFTFSGYLTGYPSQQLAVLEANIWLPLILFFIYQASLRHKSSLISQSSNLQSPNLPISQSPLPYLIGAGIAWGLTLLAGHPQSALIVGYTSSIYFFFLWLSKSKNKNQKTNDKITTSTKLVPRTTAYALRTTHYVYSTLRQLIPPYLLFITTGFGLAAIQFIPAVEYTLLSVRAEGTYDKMSGGFPMVDIIQLLLPGQVSFYSPLYVGVAGLILAVWVVFAAPTRHTTFWAIFGTVSLFISFGGNTFLYSLLYLSTPGFAIFRGQERWAFATAFSLCVLVGYGFQALQRSRARRQGSGATSQESRVRSQGSGARRQDAGSNQTQTPVPHPPSPALRTTHYALRSTPSSLTTYLFLFSLLLTFLFFYGLNDTGWSPDSPFYELLGGSSLLVILSALSWLLWKFSAQLPLALLTVLTAAVIGFDLFSVNWQTNLYPQLPEWHTQKPAVVAAIQRDAAETPAEPFRVYNEFRIYDNYGVPYEIEDLWGASPLRPNRYDQFLAPPTPIERAWELLNVKYVITWREELYVPSTIIYQEPANDGVTYVHRLETVGPRAWLVPQAQIANDAAILQKIADPDFDFQRIALLEPKAAPYLQALNQSKVSEPLRPTPYALRPTRPNPQSLSIQISTPSPALLILSETHYPGWQATLDGEPVPLLRANYVLRAVPIPAGEHTVHLSFRPVSFIIGAVISAITLLAVTIAFIVLIRSSRN